MAIEPRQIAGMVEDSMGAGGQMMPEEDSLQIELPDAMDELPEGIELADEEAVEVETEEYSHMIMEPILQRFLTIQFWENYHLISDRSSVKIWSLGKIGKKPLPRG